MKYLNVTDVHLLAFNDSNEEFQDNLDILFQSIGIRDGILGVIDPSKRRMVNEAIRRARESIRDPFRYRICDLPDNLCSLELKNKLVKRYEYLYDIKNDTFEEIKEVLRENGKISIRCLVQLEMIFRMYGVSLFDNLPGVVSDTDKCILFVIRESVSGVLVTFSSVEFQLYSKGDTPYVKLLDI